MRNPPYRPSPKGREQRSRWFRPRSGSGWLLLYVVLCRGCGGVQSKRMNAAVKASAGSSSSSSSSHRPVSQSELASSKNTTTKANARRVQNATTVLQLTETELWDGQKWKVSGDCRWTLDDEPCKPPDQQVPPKGTTFSGDWKIVTSSSRDSYGWEYVVSQPHPLRQRIWLRSVVPLAKHDVAQSADSQAVARKKRLAQRERPRWIQAIRDDFNFKGFGWSFYKSLVFANSFGVAFRLPLTFNLNTWERHPAWPSISSNIALYNPACAAVFLSASMRVEWIKWAAARLWFLLQYLLVWMVWNVSRGVVLASSALVFPVTRKLYNPPMPIHWKSAADNPPIYSRTTEERIGASLSWRITKAKGYEFRVSYWHFYAPTLTSMYDAWGRTKIPAWFARRSAALGLSTSGPIPDDPFLTCSALLSLSGFYFRKRERVLVQPTVSTTTDASSASLLNTTETSKATFSVGQKEDDPTPNGEQPRKKLSTKQLVS